MSTRVVKSNPVFQIVTLGEQEAGTLIVIPTRGGYSAERWSVESVTARVLRGTIAPLLVTPTIRGATSTGEAKLRSLIVCLDGSQVSARVLPYAASLANAMSMSLILVTAHAADDVDGKPEAGGPVSMDERSVDYLAGIVEEMRREGVSSVEWRVLHGDPTDAILQAASEIPDNVVAMATSARSEVARLIIGSVTDQVVRRASGPVLVVRATG